MYTWTWGVRLLVLTLLLLTFGALTVDAQRARPEESEKPDHSDEAESDHYHESALRRFEIITLSSLPFTAIHSYGVTRLVKMVRENKFAPEMTTQDYRIMGVGAVSFSLFIGIWDWFHTRNVDRSALLIREREEPPPVEEEEPLEGPLTRLSDTDRELARQRARTLEMSLNRGLTRRVDTGSVGFTFPLLQIRF